MTSAEHLLKLLLDQNGFLCIGTAVTLMFLRAQGGKISRYIRAVIIGCILGGYGFYCFYSDSNNFQSFYFYYMVTYGALMCGICAIFPEVQGQIFSICAGAGVSLFLSHKKDMITDTTVAYLFYYIVFFICILVGTLFPRMMPHISIYCASVVCFLLFYNCCNSTKFPFQLLKPETENSHDAHAIKILWTSLIGAACFRGFNVFLYFLYPLAEDISEYKTGPGTEITK